MRDWKPALKSLAQNASTLCVASTIACSAPQSFEYDEPPGTGRVVVTVTPEIRPCAVKRISAVSAIPGQLVLGQSARVQLAVQREALKGVVLYSFGIAESPENPVLATLERDEDCDLESAACARFTCNAVGSDAVADPSTELRSAAVRINVTVEDQQCTDTAFVWVECVEARRCGGRIVSCEQSVEGCDPCQLVPDGGVTP